RNYGDAGGVGVAIWGVWRTKLGYRRFTHDILLLYQRTVLSNLSGRMGLCGAALLRLPKWRVRICPKQLNCSSPSMIEAPGYESTMCLTFLAFSALPRLPLD